jgi:purine nucleosidase
MPLSFILDTDIGTDVDDALALAFALRHPDLDLRAVTTVSGDTQRRARIAKKLLLLAGRDDIEVAAGVQCEAPVGRRVEHGREGEGLIEDGKGLAISERDAVTLLIDECSAHHYEIATVGMQSNIATTLEREPRFVGYVPRLTVMGGAFGPVRMLGNELPQGEHNLNSDPGAALRSLNSRFDILYVPVDVTMQAWLLSSHVDALRRGDALCVALAQQIDVWTPILRGMGRGTIPDDHVALLHDPLAVACMVDRRFVTSERKKVTVALHEGNVRTFTDPAGGWECEIVTSVDSRGFAAFWLETVLGPPR